MAIEDIKVQPTEKIIVKDEKKIDEELKNLSKEELFHRLQYDETDPVIMKKIKQILKTKK